MDLKTELGISSAQQEFEPSITVLWTVISWSTHENIHLSFDFYDFCSVQCGNEKQSGSLRAYTSFTILCKNINAFSYYTFQVFSGRFSWQIPRPKRLLQWKQTQSFTILCKNVNALFFPLSTFQFFLLGDSIDKFKDSKECWCGFRGPARGSRLVRLLWSIRLLTTRMVRTW